MNAYSWILILVIILYGGLTIVAGSIQLKKRKINLRSSIILIIGGFLIILSVIPFSIVSNYTLYVLITGLGIIHVSAINNGFKMYEKINPKHHLMRLMFSLLIISLFLLK